MLNVMWWRFSWNKRQLRYVRLTWVQFYKCVFFFFLKFRDSFFFRFSWKIKKKKRSESLYDLQSLLLSLLLLFSAAPAIVWCLKVNDLLRSPMIDDQTSSETFKKGRKWRFGAQPHNSINIKRCKIIENIV